MQTIHATDVNLQYKVLLVVYLQQVKPAWRRARTCYPAITSIENPRNILGLQLPCSDEKERPDNRAYHVLEKPASPNPEDPFLGVAFPVCFENGPDPILDFRRSC
jgi:hypothetical protein